MTELNKAFNYSPSGYVHDINCHCGGHPHALVRKQLHVESQADVDPRFYDAEYHRQAMPYFHDSCPTKKCGVKDTPFTMSSCGGSPMYNCKN
jgi:hypothetical protein